MKINLSHHPTFYNSKVLKHLFDKYLKTFSEEHQLHINHCRDIISDHDGRKFVCEWLAENKILNAKSWEIRLRNDAVIGGGFDIKEDELLTMFLLECE